MLKEYIRNIPDFPEEGIMFKDITPLLSNKDAFKKTIEIFCDHYKEMDIDYVAAIEARGFIFGTPVALALNKGFIPIRKTGKLPAEKISVSYELEYGENILEIHKDAFKPGDKIILLDDLLATGGTTKASIELIEKLGGQVVGLGFLLELVKLQGRKKLEDYDIFCIMKD